MWDLAIATKRAALEAPASDQIWRYGGQDAAPVTLDGPSEWRSPAARAEPVSVERCDAFQEIR